MYLTHLMTIYRKIVGNMKLQLDENTFNAYLNEAIKRELNEAGWLPFLKAGQKAATKNAGKKAAEKAASKAPRIVGRAPRTKAPFNFARNVKNAKNARLSLKDFRNGKPLEMTVQGSKNASYNGQKFWVKKVDGKVRFFSDPSCKAEYLLKTEKGGLGAAARSSWNSELSHMKNLLNSARRNAAGTLAVTGAFGAGYGLGRNGKDGQKDPDAPWNDTPGDENGGADEGGFDGTFPWDDTTPSWTPKPAPRTAPTGPSTPAEPEAPARTPVEPIQPIQPVNMPTGVTTPEGPGLAMRQQQPSLAQSAVQVMGQTANQSNMGLNDRRATNRRTRQNANNAINQMVRDGSMTRQQGRDDKKLVRDAERALRTGKPASE